MSKNVSLRIQFLLSFFVMTVIAFGIESEAQSNTKKTTAKKKTVSAKTQKTQNQAQSKTVADLLKKIEKKLLVYPWLVREIVIIVEKV